MDHDKRNLVDLPELVLQSLACKLNTSDLLTFRHVCKRFHNISLSSVLLNRHIVDLRKVKSKDLHHFRNFLHNTNYGRSIRLVYIRIKNLIRIPLIPKYRVPFSSFIIIISLIFELCVKLRPDVTPSISVVGKFSQPI